MAAAQVEIFAFVINGTDFVRVCITVILGIRWNSVISPWALPQSMNYISNMTISWLLWSQAYLYRTRRYSSACRYRSSWSIGLSKPIALKAAFFHEVTMFQPMRPRVKWSRVENRLASRNGGSNEVDAVMPKARFFVTAAIALIG